MKLKDFLQLMRVHQWYKNLVIFLALFFSGNVVNGKLILITVAAFLSFSFISSAGYIINDFIDLRWDKKHPEKKSRPLASGRISREIALFLMLLLLLSGLAIGLTINQSFLSASVIFFVLALAYTLWLKKIVFADVLAIATLFVLRAIGGAVAIEVVISPWLILVPFFLSLFLSIGKRHGDLALLKEKAGETRKVLEEYNSGITNSLMLISTTLLIISYALYSFLSPYNNLLYTLPFALFTVFRFYYLITNGSIIARKAELVIKDMPMVIGMILWIIAAVVLIYF